MGEPTDLEQQGRRPAARAGREDHHGLVAELLRGQVTSILDHHVAAAPPTLLPVPLVVRGFRVRLDLDGAKPPVWRRLELRGDLTLSRLHDVVQVAMGWADCHLHRFRTARDPRSPHFLTLFDVDEGDQGVLEDDVRLDQLLAAPGDRLWYEYDFGDGWEHRIRVEEVLEEAPRTARCTGGRRACPPENSGGPDGYEELASWVRGGYDAARLPAGFDDPAHARGWLPPGWHPDRLDVAAVDAAVMEETAAPVPVTAELAALADELERRGSPLLREVLSRRMSHGPIEVADEEAARLTESYRVLLDIVGDGVRLTAAGYLPRAAVQQVAERTGIAQWWIGKANREDLTAPVAAVRETARALGLVVARHGRLTPTPAGIRCRTDPGALWQHIVDRLPLGVTEAERRAGLLALAVTGGGTPVEERRRSVSDLLMALGRRDGWDREVAPLAHSPTAVVLDTLAGSARARWGEVTGVDPGVATTARAVIRGPDRRPKVVWTTTPLV